MPGLILEDHDMNKPVGKFKLSRGEFIFCGVLLLGAAGYGVYRLDQARLIAQAPQIIEDATQTVAFGETLSLTHRSIPRITTNNIAWNGTVEMTLKRVVLYPSYTDALAAGESVANPNRLLHDESLPFLVVEVETVNVDAEEGDFSYVGKDVSKTDGAVTLQSFDFDLYSTKFQSDSTMSPETCWCDGASLSDYDATFDVAQGTTVHVTLGYSLEDGNEGYLDGASLTYISIYDLMSIGTPAVGGEVDEAAAH
jgi:hypothetical protein